MKQIISQQHKNGDMQRVKNIKQIFGPFAADKAPFSIVHVNGQKSETCFPFIGKPAASHDCLRRFVHPQNIHDNDKDKSLPSVIST